MSTYLEAKGSVAVVEIGCESLLPYSFEGGIIDFLKPADARHPYPTDMGSAALKLTVEGGEVTSDG